MYARIRYSEKPIQKQKDRRKREEIHVATHTHELSTLKFGEFDASKPSIHYICIVIVWPCTVYPCTLSHTAQFIQTLTSTNRNIFASPQRLIITSHIITFYCSEWSISSMCAHRTDNYDYLTKESIICSEQYNRWFILNASKRFETFCRRFVPLNG